MNTITLTGYGSELNGFWDNRLETSLTIKDQHLTGIIDHSAYERREQDIYNFHYKIDEYIEIENVKKNQEKILKEIRKIIKDTIKEEKINNPKLKYTTKALKQLLEHIWIDNEEYEKELVA